MSQSFTDVCTLGEGGHQLAVRFQLTVSQIRKWTETRHDAMVAKFLDLNKRWSQIWLKKNWHVQCMTIIPVHYCTQEKNSSLYFSSIVRQCKWPFLSRKIVKIHKFCYHGNVTSHISITYLPGTMQCAAVTTQSGAIREPPQLNTLDSPRRRATCNEI